MTVPCSQPNQLPEAPPLYTITWGLGSQQKNLGETQNAVQLNTSFLHPFLLHPFKYQPQNCYSRHTEQQTVTTLHH